MPDIAASDVSYVVEQKGWDSNLRHKNLVEMTFGDGALTYPAGGIPLDLGKMGLRVDLDSFSLTDPDNSNGFLYKYDKTNNKLRIYQGDNDNAADAPLIELVGGVATPAAATVKAAVEGY